MFAQTLSESFVLFTAFSRGVGGGEEGKQGWRGSFHVVTTPRGIFVTPSRFIIFRQILKTILFRLLYFYNVINEIQLFSYFIFDKLNFFFFSIFVSIDCLFS